MYPFLKNPFFIILSFVIGKFMSLFFWSSKMSYLIRILLLDRSPSLSDCHLSQLNSSLVYFQSHTYSYMQFKHDRFNSWLFLFMFYAPSLPYIKVLYFCRFLRLNLLLWDLFSQMSLYRTSYI